MEMFRTEWCKLPPPVQWNWLLSEAGVVRGVHVHPLHDDYVVVASGTMHLGLRDLRRESQTEGVATVVALQVDNPIAVTIPHGVAHGFCYVERSLVLVGVNRPYDPQDELGCHWQDPALEISWPIHKAMLSPRDASAGPLTDLLERVEPWQPF